MKMLETIRELINTDVAGHDKLSFGLFMLFESLLILFFMGDLFIITVKKFRKIAHPHVVWNNGYVFLLYLTFVILYNVTSMAMGIYNYIWSDDPVKMGIIIFRVFERSIILAAKTCLWYYSIKGGFEIFKINK